MAVNEPMADKVFGHATLEHAKLANRGRASLAALPWLLSRGAERTAQKAAQELQVALL